MTKGTSTNSVFPLKATIPPRTLYTRQNRSNGSQKRFGDIKRTLLRMVSKFTVAFQRKTEIVFVRNLDPYRLLFQPLIVTVRFIAIC